MDKESEKKLHAFFVALFGALFSTLFAWWAWNEFMPAIFGLPTIGFVKAFAFHVLTGAFRSRLVKE